MRGSHATTVPHHEVPDRDAAIDWSSSREPKVETIVIFRQHTPLTCFLIFDIQTDTNPAFRNELLSTDSWVWLGNVILVPLVGDWPHSYIPSRQLIQHALQYYSANLS